MDVRAAWLRDGPRQVRNAGRPGIGFCAVSAVDQALWDLKARLLDIPLVVLLGAAHDDVPIYGSGGFCSYSTSGCASSSAAGPRPGIPRVKMKVGREPERDPARLDAAREAIGDDVELFVDANGAFARKEALAWAERYARRVERDLVRGAGLVRRPRGPALRPRRGAGRARDRGRRVRLRPGRLPEPRRLRRLPAGRRHALRRHHRPALRVRPRERALDRRLGPLRAGDLGARLLRRRAAAASRVLPRPRPRSRRCSSTESPSRRTACCGPTARGRATGSSSSTATPLGSACSSRR